MSQIIKTRVLVTESPYTDVTLPVDITTEPIRPYCGASVVFYDANYDKITPTAGTVDITYNAWVTDRTNELPSNNVIDATDTHVVSWAANCDKVIATPSGIVGATYYKLRFVANAT